MSKSVAAAIASDILDLRARLISREARIDAEVATFLSRLIDEWEREIRRIIGGSLRGRDLGAVTSRRAVILSSLRRITKQELGNVIALVLSEARSVYRSEAYRVASAISGARPASFSVAELSFSRVDVPAVRAALAGRIPALSELKSLAGIPARTESLMRKDLARAIADGYRVDDLIKKWKARGGAGAVASEVRSLARTAVMSASNAAHVDTYRKNQDLVQGVRWEATWDRRTCLRCSSLHGREFLLSNAPPIPAHLSCRCVLLPVFIDKPLNAAVQGIGAYQTPTGGTYFRNKDRGFEKFLRGQSKDFRADFFPSDLKRSAFESKRLGLAQMVNPDGSIKTDDQIRRLLKRP